MASIDLTTATIETDLTTSLSVSSSSVEYDGSEASGYATVNVPLPELGDDWVIDFDVTYANPPADLYTTIAFFLSDSAFDVNAGWVTNPYWWNNGLTIASSGGVPFGGASFTQDVNPAWGSSCEEGTPTTFTVNGNQDLINLGEAPTLPESGTVYCRLSRVSTDNPAWSSDAYKGNDCGGTETDLPSTFQALRCMFYADAGRTEPLPWNGNVSDPLSIYAGAPAGEVLPSGYLQFSQFPGAGNSAWALSNVSVTTSGGSPDVTVEPSVEDAVAEVVAPSVGLTFRLTYSNA
jgi:hypothetical protein